MGTYLPALPKQAGLTPVCAAPQFGLRFLSLASLRLPTTGAVHTLDTGSDEVGLDLLAGVGAITARGPWGEVEYPEAGRRASAFAGPPSMVYLPRHSLAHITCHLAPLEALVVRAKSRRDGRPRLLQPEATEVLTFGHANWERSVFACIGPDVEADRLMMGETHTPSGNWSSYPPHKHDTNQPPERVSEEIYHFLIDPPFGFGLQTLWNPATPPKAPEQTAIVVHNGDSVIIPDGYHPVVVAPGFRMITVWACAGDRRAWGAWSAEPEYARLLEAPSSPDGEP